MTTPYYQMLLNFNADALALPPDQHSLNVMGSPVSLTALAQPPASLANNTSQPKLQSQAQTQLQVQLGPQRSVSSGGRGGGNRKGASAERRATHNAIERARRESLNGRFLQLAASLPAIADVRRPSKSLIVNKSLDFVHTSLSREVLYRHRIDSLRGENETLREQLNDFRRQAGLDPLPAPVAEELPLPLAEMGNKRRSGSLSAAIGGDCSELGEFDDDDGLHGGSSEGETSRNSPVSAPSSMQAAVAAHAHGMAAYNQLHAAQLARQQQPQHSNVMGLAAGVQQPTRASSTASTHSEDFGTPVQGSWNYASSSNGLDIAPAGSKFGGDFAFTSTSNLLNGAQASGSVAAALGGHLSVAGFQPYAGLEQSAVIADSTAPLADVFSTMREQQEQQQQIYGQFGATSYDHAQIPLHSQYLQHHQQQPQLQSQQQQQHQQQQQQQHFFDQAPRQPMASFTTVV